MEWSRYLRELQQDLARGDSTEHTHRPALKSLIEGFPDITAVNEPTRVECGAPDFSVVRGGGPAPASVGYIETKDIGASLDQVEQDEQLQRYRRFLPNLILTDYLEFRWYVDGEPRLTERLATVGGGAQLRELSGGRQRVCALLESFLAQAPGPIGDPRELAQRMAQLSHMIRDIIVQVFGSGRESDLLRDLRAAFARTLIPDLDQPENVGEFADMYAQTIAYGMFAARCNHTGPSPFQRLGAAREIPRTNPFLRQLFDTVTGTALDGEPYAGFVDDLAALLGLADMQAIFEHFGRRHGREDPVVHFYETYLAAYDPELREMRGVYYTPEPVVSYIVRSIDHLLRERFGCPDGLGDQQRIEYQSEAQENGPGSRPRQSGPRVLILDPACGTGTFLYTVVDLVRERFMRSNNAGMWSGYVRSHLLPRLFGFELLMAPYAVAHFKLGMQLAGQDLESDELRRRWAYDFGGDERLGIYLTNTLEEAERRAQRVFAFIERIIAEEAAGADRIKRDLPIMVVLGNPPYSGHSANRSWTTQDGRRVPTFIGRLIQDYQRVDGQPLGERNPKWLQDDYVKFLRWATWRIERTGAGILGFVTNHSYLDNPTFRGMRQSLMRSFDEIYLLDLHGSTRKREVAPDGSPDENVFDIQQGVAICLMVRLPKGSRE
jgi:hypothetical protein